MGGGGARPLLGPWDPPFPGSWDPDWLCGVGGWVGLGVKLLKKIGCGMGWGTPGRSLGNPLGIP